MKRFAFIYLFFLILAIPPVFGQSKIDVFIDCDDCDDDYIRTSLTFINYVMEPLEADVYILVTEESLGSGGRIYTICFCGQHRFLGINDTLIYETHRINTDEEVRNGFQRILAGGLMRYVSRTPLIKKLIIDFENNYRDDPETETYFNQWNNWVFRISMNGFLRSEESRKSYSLGGHLSADRITEDWKIRLDMSGDYDEDNFKTDEGPVDSYSRGRGFWGLIVKSVSDHWSLGSYLTSRSSTYSNIKASYGIGPAVEYNFFPYNVSTRRELRFLYSVDFERVFYIERTIYDKKRETLIEHELDIDYEIKERWGKIDIGITGSFFMHDIEKNRIRFRSEFDLRLFKGFSLSLNSGLSLIHNQLSLPIEDLSTEEILLQRSQLKTQYETWASIGFSYTFGSIYNNIVNPRF